MVTVYYPSGRKTVLINNPGHKTICKALLGKEEHIDTVIVQSLCKSNPSEVVAGSASIVKDEAKQLCKAQSLLRKKDNESMLSFTWQQLYDEFKEKCPSVLTIITSIISDNSKSLTKRQFQQILITAALSLRGRNQEMSLLQYVIGFVLTHGGCTQQDITRLSHMGLSVHPITIQRKLQDWEGIIDKEVLELRDAWAAGEPSCKKYQLIGDNWDKNILPSYRTSDRKTVSLHLFNLYALVDRFIPTPTDETDGTPSVGRLDTSTFLPSIEDQHQLMKELCFLFSSSIIRSLPVLETVFKNIYPKHIQHRFSDISGLKTKQYPLGLIDCNENKTAEVIQMMKELSKQYVPCNDGEIVEPVFFGGDRLTDERIQSAQFSMANANTPFERLEGFISKIEDFHRLMNFLEAIHKMTYDTQSGQDKGTVYYFRNLLNMRNVKGEVCNAYRPYKLLYYSILDAICLVMFLDHFGIQTLDGFLLPEDLKAMNNEEKIAWIDDTSKTILQKWFFEEEEDVFETLKEIVEDVHHPENYWLSNVLEDGRVQCHFCDKTYAFVGSLKSHEKKAHNVSIEKPKPKKKDKNQDQLSDYIVMLFKLTMLHRNLDTGVDMGDGDRVVRSAKYEMPIYNLTNKTKYLIGSIHLTLLASGLLSQDQTERFIANRFVNLQGGVNNNISLDEYLEMLNRDSKVACSGHQTKESIIKHSKGYPHLINVVKHLDVVSEERQRKGFHHQPSYQTDVNKIAKDLLEQNVLKKTPKRTLKCQTLSCKRKPYDESYRGLCTMIHRHIPKAPYHRLRDSHI